MTQTKTRSLKSSAEKVGQIVDQVIAFESGHKKTFRGIISSTIEQGEFTKFRMTNGIMANVNATKVEWFEVHPHKENGYHEFMEKEEKGN